MVRRAAAHKLGAFAKAVERDFVSRELLPLFTDLMTDGVCHAACTPMRAHGVLVQAGWSPSHVCSPHALTPASPPHHTHTRTRAPAAPRADQDSVRLLAVESCSSFAVALSREDTIRQLLPVVLKFSQDKSWRVRYNVAAQLVDLCDAMGADATRSDLTPVFVRLLRDTEAEVRFLGGGRWQRRPGRPLLPHRHGQSHLGY
jgi:serine/threonine-protein phosphatase 2A regulatory subunit A